MAKGQISEDNTTMSFVIPKTLKEELGSIATKENRSMGNLICTLVDKSGVLTLKQSFSSPAQKLPSPRLPSSNLPASCPPSVNPFRRISVMQSLSL